VRRTVKMGRQDSWRRRKRRRRRRGGSAKE